MLVVQKFGGSSVATIDHIKRVAKIVQKEISKDNQVIVVVSAMGKFTDTLADYSNLFPQSDNSANSEKDVILSAGEQISAALLALSLMSLGITARSFLSWQIPIITDNKHTKSNIVQINTTTIRKCLQSNIVPIITGFQGYNKESERITTIGRGGSDISAVEISASINADRCDIYTDVNGIYTADPNLVPNARKLDSITYEEMLEIASNGAQVLHPNSVLTAMRYKIKLQVLSSFSVESGTLLITKKENMINKPVTAVTCNNNEACITVHDTIKHSEIFSPLAEANININIIVHNIDSNNITFTAAKGEVQDILKALKSKKITVKDKVSIISVTGIGMVSHSGVANTTFQELEQNKITIIATTTSEIKISVVIDEQYREVATRLLHTVHGLDR